MQQWTTRVGVAALATAVVVHKQMQPLCRRGKWWALLFRSPLRLVCSASLQAWLVVVGVVIAAPLGGSEAAVKT
jgi:hypothetical protein